MQFLVAQGTHKVEEIGKEHIGQDESWAGEMLLSLCIGKKGMREGGKLGRLRRLWGLCLLREFRR